MTDTNYLYEYFLRNSTEKEDSGDEEPDGKQSDEEE